MLNIKCFRCGKSFALDQEVAESWLQEHKEERPKHYPAQCHHCRRTMKVPVKQIQRRRPRAVEQAPEAGDG